MRTPRQCVYDKFYYDFEAWLNRWGRDWKTFKSFAFKPFGKEFDSAYKNSILPFWAKYGVHPGKHWIKYSYSISHSLDPRCIPRGIWFGRIIPHFNSMMYERQLQDKNLHHLLFHDTKRPETIYKCPDGEYCNDDFSPISKEEAYARCFQEGDYIIKPTTDTFEGSGISAFHGSDGPEAISSVLDLYQNLPHIVQRFVRQHPDLAAFNASTFNTIRLVTIVLNGKVHILSSILRIGADGNIVDNVSQGGYQCTINPDGTLQKLAYTCRSSKHAAYGEAGGVSQYVEQTHTGARFEGFRIPSWDKLRQTACDLALRLPYMKLIGWDMGVDADGDVVLIEFNAFPEQNEATCGPSFGDLTDEVLTDVFLNSPGKSVLSRHYRKVDRKKILKK